MPHARCADAAPWSPRPRATTECTPSAPPRTLPRQARRSAPRPPGASQSSARAAWTANPPTTRTRRCRRTCSTSTWSKRLRGTTSPCVRPDDCTVPLRFWRRVPFGACTRSPSMRQEPAASTTLATPMRSSTESESGLMPSPHTLSRGNTARSSRATVRPRSARNQAALVPAGPAPTITTSKFASTALPRSPVQRLDQRAQRPRARARHRDPIERLQGPGMDRGHLGARGRFDTAPREDAAHHGDLLLALRGGLGSELQRAVQREPQIAGGDLQPAQQRVRLLAGDEVAADALAERRFVAEQIEHVVLQLERHAELQAEVVQGLLIGVTRAGEHAAQAARGAEQG